MQKEVKRRAAPPPKSRAAKSDRLMRLDEVTATVGLDQSTIFRLEQKGRFPRRRKITTRAVGWLASEISEWIAKRPAAALAKR